MTEMTDKQKAKRIINSLEYRLFQVMTQNGPQWNKFYTEKDMTDMFLKGIEEGKRQSKENSNANLS